MIKSQAFIMKFEIKIILGLIKQANSIIATVTLCLQLLTKCTNLLIVENNIFQILFYFN